PGRLEVACFQPNCRSGSDERSKQKKRSAEKAGRGVALVDRQSDERSVSYPFPLRETTDVVLSPGLLLARRFPLPGRGTRKSNTLSGTSSRSRTVRPSFPNVFCALQELACGGR